MALAILRSHGLAPQKLSPPHACCSMSMQTRAWRAPSSMRHASPHHSSPWHAMHMHMGRRMAGGSSPMSVPHARQALHGMKTNVYGTVVVACRRMNHLIEKRYQSSVPLWLAVGGPDCLVVRHKEAQRRVTLREARAQCDTAYGTVWHMPAGTARSMRCWIFTYPADTMLQLAVKEIHCIRSQHTANKPYHSMAHISCTLRYTVPRRPSRDPATLRSRYSRAEVRPHPPNHPHAHIRQHLHASTATQSEF